MNNPHKPYQIDLQKRDSSPDSPLSTLVFLAALMMFLLLGLGTVGKAVFTVFTAEKPASEVYQERK